jgi:hypothetical protein
VKRRHTVPLVSVGAFVAAATLTAASGVPSPLPGIALGSEPLFYIERGVAAFAVLVIAMSLLARGLQGQLPSQVSTTGLTYPESLERAVTSSDAAITALAQRVDQLDQDLRKRDEVTRLLSAQVLDLDETIRERKDAGELPPGDEVPQ